MLCTSMTRVACLAFLLLLLDINGSAYEEKEFSCPHFGDHEPSIPSTAVCNGTVDCIAGADESNGSLYDESPEICAPQPYLEDEVLLQSRGVTSMSAQLSWSKVTRHVPDHSLKLAGYFLSGRSAAHSFQNSLSPRLNSYQVHWLKPWTNYEIILRPFYTENGKPETAYKLGRAALAVLHTLPSEPEIPVLVSVLSPKQRNVLLNIVGPAAWNSDPLGFHVRWEATNERQGPQGEQDVPLPAEWSPDENVLNTTLPLQGGLNYRLFVSAEGASGLGGSVRGPEVEVYVSVTLDSYDVSAKAIDSTKAVVSWRASEVVDHFWLTVYTEDGKKNLVPKVTRGFKGKKEVTSMYNTIITELQPWTFYLVSLKGCFELNCSDAVNTTFSTLPEDFPAPELSWIKATGTTSIQIVWHLPVHDQRSYDGFRVRYCPNQIETCFLVHTKNHIMDVHGLQPATLISVEVRTQFRGMDGRPLLGPPVTATVTTWTNVPIATLWHQANIQDAIGTSFLYWQCSNSSVDYLQYKTEYGEWKTCNDSAECDCTVDYGSTRALTSGHLRLTHQILEKNFNVWVRCCNDYGCGQEANVAVSSHISGPPSLAEVTVFPSQHNAVLQYVPQGSSAYDGLEVTWHCKGEEELTHHTTVPHDYYYDSRKEKTIDGLSTSAELCKFFVSLYRDVNEKRYFSLPVQAVEA